MSINDKEMEILIENAKFLEENDYKMDSDNDSIIFSNGVNQILITFAPRSDTCEVSIRFIRENRYFNIGWIAFVRSDLKVNYSEKLNSAVRLLKYIEENYDKVIQYDYCIESNKLVDEFIKKSTQKQN